MNRLIICSVLVLGFISCKKYEEGPLISFRSAKHRIAGDWRVESFTANGTDSMSYFRRNHLDGLWHFNKHEGYSDPSLKVTKDTLYARGTWSYTTSDHHTSIEIILTDINCHSTSCTNSNTLSDWPFRGSYKILRSKENDMKLSHEQDGIEYKIHFKQSV